MRTMAQKIRNVAAYVLAVYALGSILSGAAYAQAADRSEGEAVLEEIIVTGTKREVDIQQVPISVSVIGAEALSQSRYNDVRALGTLAPGLVLSNPTGFNAVGGGMRGTGTNIILVTQDAPVSFLVDEFPLSHVTSQFVNLFDVQQIEVYRGPQGTLFGKNTTGGVISITSKKPVLGQYSGEIEADYGAYSSDQTIYSLKGALNLPLGDTLALRIAAIADFDEGYYEDGKHTATFPDNVPFWGLFGIPAGTPLPPEVDATTTGTGQNLGGKEVLASKVKLLWQPSEAFSAYLISEFVRDNSDSPPGVNENIESDLLTLLGFPSIAQAGEGDVFNTLITHNGNMQMDAGHQVDVEGLYLTLDWNLNHGLLKSITGYREEEQIFPSTYTGESFLTLFDSTRNTERETFQQEFRYVSQFDGPFNFVAGASYYHDEFEFLAFFSVGLTTLLPVMDPVTGTFVTPEGWVSLNTRDLFDYQFQGTEQERDQYALYWDGSFNFTDEWGLTLGLRYSYDDKEFLRFVEGGGPCTTLTEPQDILTVAGECRDSRSQFISRAGLEPRAFDGKNIPLPLSAFGTVVDTGDNWNETTYRIVVDYTPVEGQLFYASYATGFLSGGFSETCATVPRCAYDPETNTNIEVGFKGDLLNDTLRFNAAAYFTEYEDLQRAVVALYTAATGLLTQETVTVNAGESEVLGIDLEALWVPTDNWTVRGAINWLDHDYKTGSVLPDLRGTNEPVDLTQFDVPFSPEFKASLGVDYEIPLSRGARVLLSGLVNYQDDAETDVFNGPNTRMQSRTLIDVAATYHDSTDRFSITGYVANLLDEEYRFSALPVSALWNFTHYGAPISYGVRFNAKFGDAF